MHFYPLFNIFISMSIWFNKSVTKTIGDFFYHKTCTMPKPFTENFKKGFWTALYEYLIITMPVGIYVFLEAFHKNDWNYLYTTPEWAIATIFLSFISLSKYLASIGASGKAVFEPIVGIIGILILTIIIASTINANISIERESQGAVVCRVMLLLIATVIFFIFMTGTKLIRKES